MSSYSRYDLNDMTTSIKTFQNKPSIDNHFSGTFQPSSYLNFQDNRVFESRLDENDLDSNKKLISTQGFESRSRSSLGFERSLHSTGRNFYDGVGFDVLKNHQDNVLRLESIINHKDSIIEDLKFQKSALGREIEDLSERIRSFDYQKENERNKYYSKIEEMKYQIDESNQIIKNLELELNNLNEIYKEAKETLSNTSQEYSSAISDNKSLKSTIESLKDHIIHLETQIKTLNDPKSDFTIFKLNEKIKNLQEVNENLSMSLNSRPTFKDIKEKDMVISNLKEKIYTKNNRSRSTSQNKARQSIKKDKELYTLPKGTLPSAESISTLFNDILGVLKLQNFNEILPVLHKLKKKSKSNDLEEKISKLVIDLSPEGSFHPVPSPHQIWKWIRKVVEDYNSLKKDLEKEEKNKLILNRILGALGILDSSQIIKHVNILIGENHASKALFEKIDLMLENDPKALLKDFKYLVNENL